VITAAVMELCAAGPPGRGPAGSGAVGTGPWAASLPTTTPSGPGAPAPLERPRLPVLHAPTREGSCRRRGPGEFQELCGTAPCPAAVKAHSPACLPAAPPPAPHLPCLPAAPRLPSLLGGTGANLRSLSHPRRSCPRASGAGG